MTYAKRALIKINDLKLGDVVYYKGCRYLAIDGAADPFWSIHNGQGRRDYIHKSELKMEPLIKRFWFSFKSTFKYYMGYWYQIDVAKNGKFMFKG